MGELGFKGSGELRVDVFGLVFPRARAPSIRTLPDVLSSNGAGHLIKIGR